MAQTKVHEGKFSPATLVAKRRLKVARIAAGLDMNEAAKALGISRKKLEDTETVRNYGRFLDWDFMLSAAIVYKVRIDYFIGNRFDIN